MATNRLDDEFRMLLIANNLKNLRKSAGLTTTQIADVIDKTRQAYNNYESGKREMSVLDLMKLSEFYNISMDLIVGSKIASGDKISIPFDHFQFVDDHIIETTPKYVSSSNDDIILLTRNDTTIDYYLKSQVYHEKIETLFSYNNNIYSSILFRLPNGGISFTVDKVLKHVSKENVSNIIILGIYAGSINKDFNITDFF